MSFSVLPESLVKVRSSVKQMMRVTPRRVTTLQCSQIGFTLLRTFTRDSGSTEKLTILPRFRDSHSTYLAVALDTSPWLTCTRSLEIRALVHAGCWNAGRRRTGMRDAGGRERVFARHNPLTQNSLRRARPASCQPALPSVRHRRPRGLAPESQRDRRLRTRHPRERPLQP